MLTKMCRMCEMAHPERWLLRKEPIDPCAISSLTESSARIPCLSFVWIPKTSDWRLPMGIGEFVNAPLGVRSIPCRTTKNDLRECRTIDMIIIVLGSLLNYWFSDVRWLGWRFCRAEPAKWTIAEPMCAVFDNRITGEPSLWCSITLTV